MKKIIFILLTSLACLACDSKKTSIAGTVVDKATGEGVANVLVSYIQCKENGEDCTEMIIGQMYTLQDGSFKIDQKRANKSKTRWVTVHNGTKKIAQIDNVSLMDKSIRIEVTL
ncbi:MAG: hypothetical protein H7141_01680 [Burkholderiales bacterium]|nr:hypothetical protein [Bacteroidia bacterium]